MELFVGFVLSIVAGLACEVILRSTKGRSLLSLLGRSEEEPAPESGAGPDAAHEDRTRAELLSTGRDVLAIAMSAQAFDHDYVEAGDPEVNDLIGEFLQQVRDLGELGDVVQPADRVKAGTELTAQLRELAEHGYAVWGALEPRTIQTGVEKTEVLVSTIRVIRSDSIVPGAGERTAAGRPVAPAFSASTGAAYP